LTEEPTELSKKDLLKITRNWQQKLNIKSDRIQIRKMTNKWGSNSSKGIVILNSDLTKLPEEIVEYVVLHELLHVVVPDHGRKFKAMLSAYMPDWEERHAQLNLQLEI
jgi:predicted metal-dependent hydrolase